MSSPPDRPRPRCPSVRFALLQIAGLAAANHLLTRLVPLLLPGAGGSRIHDDLRLFGEAAVADLARAAVTLAIVPGVLEELIFRGLLFALLERLAGLRWAVLGSAIAFGAVHLDLHLSMIAMLLGLQLGAMRSVSGLGLAVGAHVANNLVVLLLRYHDDAGLDWLPHLDASLPGATFWIALALATGAWARLAQAMRRPRSA
jgi:membrane protease YdiL (CAAX protease family)